MPPEEVRAVAARAKRTREENEEIAQWGEGAAAAVRDYLTFFFCQVIWIW